jgi:hypothetical protein
MTRAFSPTKEPPVETPRPAGSFLAQAAPFARLPLAMTLLLTALPCAALLAQEPRQAQEPPQDQSRSRDGAAPGPPSDGPPSRGMSQAPPASRLAFPPVKVTWSFEARHVSCTEAPVYTGTVSFPRETGSPAADARIAALAESWLAEARARALQDVSASPDPCAQVREGGEGPGLFMEITYRLFRPSPGILGTLFTDRGYDGGTRAWLGYTAFTWRLDTGEPLAPADVFPDPGKGRAGLWNLIWAATCGADPPKETLPRFYGGAPCSGKTAPPPPEDFLADAETLEDLGSLVLTEKGALLSIDPSSAWSWAEGPFTLEIARAELESLGADPAFWGKERPRPPGGPESAGVRRDASRRSGARHPRDAGLVASY